MVSDTIKRTHKAEYRSPRLASEFRSSAEDVLLINCARTKVASEKIERVLNPNLDWEYIIASAVRHRIAPLLYYSIKEVSDSLVSPKVVETLQRIYLGALTRNLLILRELSEVLNALLDAQVEVILLKGVALAQTVYPDIALRPFDDIDLLIFKEDQHKVEAKLSQIGYDLLRDYRPGFVQQFGVAVRHVKRNEVPIDLHWHVAHPPYSKYISVAPFWESAVSVNMEGIDTLVLSPENLLIHLCLHVSKHRCSQLLWLVDISEVIHYYGEALDWELLLEEIQRYRIHSVMRYVLHLVKELFDPPMPGFVLERLGSYRSSSFEAQLFDALANPNVTGAKGTIAKFLTLDGIMPKIQYIFGRLFPSRDFVLKRYPNRSVYSAYCLRVSRALWEGMRALLQVCTEYRTKRQGALLQNGGNG